MVCSKAGATEAKIEVTLNQRPIILDAVMHENAAGSCRTPEGLSNASGLGKRLDNPARI
jgi:hypothetical protein